LSSIQLDPSLPAAGKTEGPEQKYSHVYPRLVDEQVVLLGIRFTPCRGIGDGGWGMGYGVRGVNEAITSDNNKYV